MSIDIKSIKTKQDLHDYYDKVLEREQKTRELRGKRRTVFSYRPVLWCLVGPPLCPIRRGLQIFCLLFL